jgi:outer membrane lipoprotein-sorting protein
MNDRKRHWRVGCIWVAAVFLWSGMLLLQAVPAAAEPPRFAAVLAGMKAKLAATSDYQCRFETQSTNGDQTRDVVLAYYYRQPAQIRMEVLEGPYPGSLLIYNGETDAGRVRVLAGNRLVAFLQRMLYGEYFAVDHEWVVDLRGNGIHESDWPHFIRTHEAYLSMGTSRFVREEILDGRVAYVYRLVSDAPEKTMAVKSEDLWVDAETFFPVRYFQYDDAGRLIRKAIVTELRFNAGISERLFTEFYPDRD